MTSAAPPFLIIHGDEDPLVPHHQSHLLYEALAKAGVDVTFHTLVGAGHGGPAFEHPATLGIVSAFFDRHLRAGATPEPWSAGTSPAPAMVTVRAQPPASEGARR